MCGGRTLRLVHLVHSQALLWNSEAWAHVHPVWLASGGYGTFPSLLALDWNRSWSCVTAHRADTSLCAVRVILSLWLLESLLPTTHTFSGALFSPFTLSVKPRLPFYLKCPHFAGPLEDQPGQVSVVLGCQCLLGSLKILLVPTSIDTGAKLAVAVTAHPSEDPLPLLLEHPVLQLQANLGPNRALCQKQRTEPLRSSLGFNSLWFCSNVLVWIVFIYPVGDLLWFFSAIANTQAVPVASFSVHSVELRVGMCWTSVRIWPQSHLRVCSVF